MRLNSIIRVTLLSLLICSCGKKEETIPSSDSTNVGSMNLDSSVAKQREEGVPVTLQITGDLKFVGASINGFGFQLDFPGWKATRNVKLDRDSVQLDVALRGLATAKYEVTISNNDSSKSMRGNLAKNNWNFVDTTIALSAFGINRRIAQR